MIKLLMTVYPKHEWLEWRFRAAPQKFWRTVENQRRYMDWMAKQVGVLKMEDWYDIDRSDLVEKGGTFATVCTPHRRPAESNRLLCCTRFLYSVKIQIFG
jgi:hypothetical protein